MEIRDRIIAVKKVKASDLVENPFNWRTHPERQKQVLRAIFQEIGFAGALLTRQLEDGRYQLIDGHCRKEELGNRMVRILVTDLTEQEAKKLLAAYDPISTLAGKDEKKLGELLRDIETGSEHLATLFSELGGNKALKTEELSLDLEAGDEETPEAPSGAIQASHVRMVQLFLNTETLPLFEEYISQLGPYFEKTSLTDVVMEALKREAKKAKKAHENNTASV